MGFTNNVDVVLSSILLLCLVTYSYGGNFMADRALPKPPLELPNEKQMLVNACLNSGCKSPGLCYVPYPNSCFKFIMCEPVLNDQMYATAMSCGFGTKWRKHPDEACERHDLVSCSNDKCSKNPNMVSYKHEDNHCRTYWRCHEGKSVPECCKHHQRFTRTNGTHGECRNDKSCNDVCPHMNDATCRGGGVNASNLQDGNCRTHWDCSSRHQQPACCAKDHGFNVFTSSCELDTKCGGTCPPQYTLGCSKLGTKSYELVNVSCRAYMKCDQGEAKRQCCRSGQAYDAKLQQCVDTSDRKCALEGCPSGFEDECRFEAIPGDPYGFKNLDAHGGAEMPCSVGTIFNLTQCRCVRDPSPIVVAKTAKGGCNMAIHFVPPQLGNKGTLKAKAALLMIGDHGQGEKGVGNMTSTRWDGGDGIFIPYYGSQTLWDFYICMLVKPTTLASGVKQILATSCFIYASNNAASLEVSLMDGNITVRVEPNNGQLFTATTRFTNDKQVEIELLRSDSTVGIFVREEGIITFQKTQQLTGAVRIERGGFRFGHCRSMQNVRSFIGHVSNIKFSKCVPAEKEMLLTPILAP